jgi:hypothetical protein
MKICPDCAEEVRAAARKCRFCGFIFSESSDAERTSAAEEAPEQTQSLEPAPSRLGRITAGKVLFGLILLALVAYVKFGIPDTSSRRSSVEKSATSPMTPLQKKVREATEYWEEEKRVEAAWPQRVRNAEVGVVTTIVGPGTSWPCAPSVAAIKELMQWHKASLAEPDSQANEVAFDHLTNSLTRTRSIMVEPRERVKILEKETGVRKISVIEHKGNYGVAYMSETAQGCWVEAEAVTR